jgi:predicted AAA+ superfamily ATPase
MANKAKTPKKRAADGLTSPDELFAVLREFNPWWEGGEIAGLPNWRRSAFRELMLWLRNPPAHRALLLTGARQVGKTTLLWQAVQELLREGVKAEQVLYVTFDHPLFKLAGIDAVLKLWREMKPATEKTEYLLLDEVQNTTDWQVWLKHQTDLRRDRRIAVTGSALPLVEEGQESGVGRWHTIKLPTLSFAEYLQLKNIDIPSFPEARSLVALFDWTPRARAQASAAGAPLVAHFHQYLLRGGFPQTALVADIRLAQKLLREDIIDKVLKRDMTALYGVRRVIELEKVFLYLCQHDGGVLDMQALCSTLELNKTTVNNFLELLAATHLIYKLKPLAYGKEVLRAKHKVYLADAAIAGSVMLWGQGLLENPTRLGKAVETSVFKHLFTRYYPTAIDFAYWRGKNDIEVDIVAEFSNLIVPFEVKYAKTISHDDLRGLRALCRSRPVPRAYVITRDIEDFSVETIECETEEGSRTTVVARIPAPLACYWLSKAELDIAE